MSTQSWIDAGKPAETATEAPPVETASVETAPVETAPITEGAPAEAPAGQPRGPDGKFAAAAVEQAVADGATAAEIEALEAWLDEKGEQKLSIPLTARIPWKVAGKDGFSTIKEIQTAHQFQKDYDRNNQALREARRELEVSQKQAEIDRKVMEAERKMVQAEVDKFNAARGDPEAMERLAADQERLRTDPEFAKDREDALRARLGDVRLEAEQELTRYTASAEVADQAADYITQLATQYPGVDAEDTRRHFGRLILTGEMPIGPEPGQFNARTVDQYFQREAARLKAAAEPALKELEGLRKRLEAIEAKERNGNVVAALRNGAPATGAPSPRSPAPPADARTAVAGETLQDRAERWAKRR